MNLKITIYGLLLLMNASLFSQSQVSGRITDEKGNPLASAMVKVENSNLGAKTDAEGNYKISFPKQGSYQLVVSILGYTKKSIYVKVEENKSLVENVSLESSNTKVKAVKVKGQKNKTSEASTLAEQESGCRHQRNHGCAGDESKRRR